MAILLAALPLAGCFHPIHELYTLDSGEGLLGTTLAWEVPEDAGSALHSLTLSVGGASTPFTRNYRDEKEAAGERIPVAAGRNDLLATANMTESDGFLLSGMPATRADAAVGDVTVSLKDPASSPDQAWFGVTGAEIRDGAITLAEATLQRLLSTITVDLAHVPAGTRIELTVNNVAKSVNLTAKGANGRWGLPSADPSGPITLAALTAATDGPLKLAFRVLPTASTFTRCTLTFRVTSANGNETQTVIDAPGTEGGIGYLLDLDFNALRPYLYLDSYSISPWEDGWTVSGEILNPSE